MLAFQKYCLLHIMNSMVSTSREEHNNYYRKVQPQYDLFTRKSMQIFIPWLCFRLHDFIVDDWWPTVCGASAMAFSLR
ncbi:hypothetical protein T4A_8187 [Trichinella pseudospiralis]|uniref:Uncharacterized protein n=1 Tax=Trichinella pseudospiralis TaxID=6337 RepID=A0A0V1EGT5_TRIPS|nr:hypothetical protein T4A_8187 [Trichinella pseudospiralis]